MPQSPMEIALLKSRLEKLTGGPGAPAWPADQLNTNLLDEGTISQESSLRSMFEDLTRMVKTKQK